MNIENYKKIAIVKILDNYSNIYKNLEKESIFKPLIYDKIKECALASDIFTKQFKETGKINDDMTKYLKFSYNFLNQIFVHVKRIMDNSSSILHENNGMITSLFELKSLDKEEEKAILSLLSISKDSGKKRRKSLKKSKRKKKM